MKSNKNSIQAKSPISTKQHKGIDMKGKIDEKGFLRIYRGDANPNHYQPQYCPFQTAAIATPQFELMNMKPCGCWCPHFGEPHNELKFSTRADGFTTGSGGTGNIVIDICHGKRLIFDEFTDERTG